MDTHTPAGSKRFKIVVVSLAAVGALVALAPVVYALARHGQRVLVARECERTLKQFALAMKMYSNEDKNERMPPVSAPGHGLVPDPSAEQAYAKMTFAAAAASPEAVRAFFTNREYYYLGFGISNEADVEFFAKEFRKAAAANIPFDYDVTPNGKQGPEEHPMLFRLREGIERAFEYKMGFGTCNPGASAQAQKVLPILIERVGLHGEPAAHVLYLDGHVEYIPYPGKWPMTETTIHTLEELDALGTHPGG